MHVSEGSREAYQKKLWKSLWRKLIKQWKKCSASNLNRSGRGSAVLRHLRLFQYAFRENNDPESKDYKIGTLFLLI